MEELDARILAAIIAAFAAAILSAINVGVSIWSTNRQLNNSSLIEIARLRETYSSQIRSEAVELIRWRNICFRRSLTDEEVHLALSPVSMLRLLVRTDNKHYESLMDCLDSFVDIFTNKPMAERDPDKSGDIVPIVQRLVKDIWEQNEDAILLGRTN